MYIHNINTIPWDRNIVESIILTIRVFYYIEPCDRALGHFSMYVTDVINAGQCLLALTIFE